MDFGNIVSNQIKSSNNDADFLLTERLMNSEM